MLAFHDVQMAFIEALAVFVSKLHHREIMVAVRVVAVARGQMILQAIVQVITTIFLLLLLLKVVVTI
jgi:hypothetical protein